jgi:hypothetical protein
MNWLKKLFYREPKIVKPIKIACAYPEQMYFCESLINKWQ